MTKLEYSDLYRFLVSLGIVLIGLSVIVPWLFLREPFDVSLRLSEISDLPLTAQELITHRQSTALWFIQNTMWISTALAASGLASLITGLALWIRKQHLLDQREKLETEKVELEIEKRKRELKPLTPGEIAEKGIRKTEEEMQVKEEREPSIHSRVQRYFHIEETFLGKLSECFGEGKVLIQQKIRHIPYDAILLLDGPQLTDVILEIRPLSRLITPRSLEQTIDQLVYQTTTYMEATNRRVTTIPLFTVPPGDQGRRMMERCSSTIQDQAQTHNVRIRPIFVTDQELGRLKCDKLRTDIRSRASTL